MRFSKLLSQLNSNVVYSYTRLFSPQYSFHLQSLARKAQNCSDLPSQISKNRAIFIIVLDLFNIGFILDAAFNQPSVSNHLLKIFIANLLVYFVYYTIMKLVKREKIPHVAKAISIIGMGEISLNLSGLRIFSVSPLRNSLVFQLYKCFEHYRD